MQNLTWQQAHCITGIHSDNWSWPENIHHTARSRYVALQHEILFNQSNGVNLDYTEYLRNESHRIIAECLYRK